jgi:hypothetical protein
LWLIAPTNSSQNRTTQVEISGPYGEVVLPIIGRAIGREQFADIGRAIAGQG